MTVYVLTEHDYDDTTILGVFSTLDTATAQTTAPWVVADWTDDGTLYAEDANFHRGIGVDYWITPFVLDVVR